MEERKLKQLFDFQKFERDRDLEKVIRGTEKRFGKELSANETGSVVSAREKTVTDPTSGKDREL